MKSISIYNDIGEIHTTIQGDELSIQATIDNITDGWVEGDWFQKNKYVANGEVLDRPANPTTVSGLTLNNVPVPATVFIDNVPYETSESTVEIEFSFPGTHKVKVVAFPYLDAEFEIENPA